MGWFVTRELPGKTAVLVRTQLPYHRTLQPIRILPAPILLLPVPLLPPLLLPLTTLLLPVPIRLLPVLLLLPLLLLLPTLLPLPLGVRKEEILLQALAPAIISALALAQVTMQIMTQSMDHKQRKILKKMMH